MTVATPAPASEAYRTELSPVSFLRRSACVYPDKVAVVHGKRRITCRELDERVNRLASALILAGIAPGDRVAFLPPNIPPLLEAHYGVPAAGAVLVAINTRLGRDEVAYILRHCGARMVSPTMSCCTWSRAAACRPSALTTPARRATRTKSSSPAASPNAARCQWPTRSS
jgi:acyl-CoA synthetase (AMP-forming)/AMP-acid ligase II